MLCGRELHEAPVAAAMLEGILLFILITIIAGDYSAITIIPAIIVGVLLGITQFPRSHPHDAV